MNGLREGKAINRERIGKEGFLVLIVRLANEILHYPMSGI